VRANKLYFTHTSGGNSFLHRFVTVFVHSGWKNKFRLRVIRSPCGECMCWRFSNKWVRQHHFWDPRHWLSGALGCRCVPLKPGHLLTAFWNKKRLRKASEIVKIKYVSSFLSAIGAAGLPALIFLAPKDAESDIRLWQSAVSADRGSDVNCAGEFA
jgi:hypothetical protein